MFIKIYELTVWRPYLIRSKQHTLMSIVLYFTNRSCLHSNIINQNDQNQICITNSYFVFKGKVQIILQINVLL